MDAKHYIVDASPLGWTTAIWDFLDRNLLKDGSSVKMSFSESGNVYEGTIKGSAEAGYTLHLPFPTRLLKTPSSACTKKGCKLIVDVSRRAFRSTPSTGE